MEETLQQIAGQAQGIGTAFLAVFTLANCFFGYKLRRVWITVAGFLIGLAAGFGIGLLISGSAGVALIVGVVLGAVLTIVAFRLYLVGIFLMCFGSAYLFLYPLIPITWLAFIVATAGGILVGWLAVRLQRPMVILSTGIGCGMSAGQLLLTLFGVTNPAVILTVGAVLAAAGTVVQFKTAPAE